jgi:hypothetical protein
MGQNEQRRIILDTNLWISWLITKNYSQLDALLAEQEVPSASAWHFGRAGHIACFRLIAKQ